MKNGIIVHNNPRRIRLVLVLQMMDIGTQTLLAHLAHTDNFLRIEMRLFQRKNATRLRIVFRADAVSRSKKILRQTQRFAHFQSIQAIAWSVLQLAIINQHISILVIHDRHVLQCDTGQSGNLFVIHNLMQVCRENET